MSTAIATRPLLTVEEFQALPESLGRIELVRGEVIKMPPPGFEHGFICGNIAFRLREFAAPRNLGRVTTNDTGVITQRQPDSVRGPDVSYYSFERLPAGESPKGYATVKPDITVDVKSPTDRWRPLLEKMTELLSSGVTVACVIDPERRQAHLFRDDAPVQIVDDSAVLEFPEVLPGFQVPLADILRV